MSTCKYCNAEISWLKINDRNVPMNADNTQHNCKTSTKPVVETNGSDSLTDALAAIKAYADFCVSAKFPVEFWNLSSVFNTVMMRKK